MKNFQTPQPVPSGKKIVKIASVPNLIDRIMKIRDLKNTGASLRLGVANFLFKRKNTDFSELKIVEENSNNPQPTSPTLFNEASLH